MPLRGLITTGRSPHALFSVGPTVRIASVRRFAALLLPAGPPTLSLASGPPSCSRLRPVGLAFASAHAGSLRYAASRPYYYRPVPPRSGGSGRYCVVRGARSSASSCTLHVLFID